jgi:hypothetical protein
MAAVEHPAHEAAPPPVAADGIPVGARRRAATPGQVLAATITGAVLLALLAASDLPSWAERLPDGRLTPVLRQAAAEWSRAVAELGLAAPHEALRQAVQRLMDREW